MRVGIVVLYESSKQKLIDIAGGLSEGISANGHTVEIIDGKLESDKKISYFDYLLVGSETISALGVKLPNRVTSYLGQCGTLTGKKSFAFILKKGLRTGKTLLALMKAMEHEGMFIKYSEVLQNRAEAREIGKRLKIQ